MAENSRQKISDEEAVPSRRLQNAWVHVAGERMGLLCVDACEPGRMHGPVRAGKAPLQSLRKPLSFDTRCRLNRMSHPH
jgi:hypothetical protein